MVFCGLALLVAVFGNLITGEDASSLSRDKKTLSSFIRSPFYRGAWIWLGWQRQNKLAHRLFW